MSRKGRIHSITFYFALYAVILFVLFELVVLLLNANWSNVYLGIRESQKEVSEVMALISETYDIHEAVSVTSGTWTSAKKVNTPTYDFPELKERIESVQSVLWGKYLSTKDRFRFRYRNLYYILDVYLRRVEEVENAQLRGTPEFYITALVQGAEHYMEIYRDEADMLVLSLTEKVDERYEELSGELVTANKTVFLLNVVALFMLVPLTARLSSIIIDPIRNLAAHTVRQGMAADLFSGMAGGKRYKHNYKEMDMLISAYDEMTLRIKALMEQMQEKARIERELQEQKIYGLEVQNSLKESRLDYLQAQISPHFIFNTINSIMGIAQMENSRRTYDMLAHFASITRYMLNISDRNVPLRDELEMLRNYLELQRIRFDGVFTYDLTIADEHLLDLMVPPLLLQPLAENSILHGFEGKKQGAHISVTIYRKASSVHIIYRDNGVGIPQKIIDDILSKPTDVNAVHKPGERRQLGLGNVIHRMRLLYGKDSISIISVMDVGAEIRMVLSADAGSFGGNRPLKPGYSLPDEQKKQAK